jgi:uncharacterized protein YijF (DUF1287 family)
MRWSWRGIAAWVACMIVAPAAAQAPSTDALRLVAAAEAQTAVATVYDGAYRRIGYPGGDVPPDRGVCTDVVVRAYRALGIDLQVAVHEDMRRDFAAYPALWGLRRPDPNIDHRRVPNLQAYLRRAGAALAVGAAPDDYLAGDLVTWMLPGNLPHIGIVAARRSPGGVPLIVHNVGAGPRVEDVLFAWPITGHYRHFPGTTTASPGPAR